MLRPIALVLPLSLAVLACAPVAVIDETDLRAPAAADEEASGAPLRAAPREQPERRRDAAIVLALAPRVMPAWTAFVADEVSEQLPDGTLLYGHVPVDIPYGAGGAGGAGEGTAGLGSLGLVVGGHGDGAAPAYGVSAAGETAPEVMSSLDKDLIRRVIRAHIAEVRRCYEHGLARDPGLRGRLVIAFTVDRAGAVTGSEVVESTLADPAVGTCVARSALRWHFPAGLGDIKITYPFLFEPG